MKTYVNIFKNKFKKADKHPDYTGDGSLPDKQPIKLAGWLKKDKNGNNYLSVAIQIGDEKEKQDNKEKSETTQPDAKPDLEPTAF